MASIQEISAQNLEAFVELIPKILQEKASDSNLHFYGIEESGQASGVIIGLSRIDDMEIKYLYVLPYLRGTGVIDTMLMTLFFQLRDEGYSTVSMRYVPTEYPTLSIISKRFEFEETKLSYAYFTFKGSEVRKSKAASVTPRNIIRVRYLPPNKQQRLFSLIDKNMQIYDRKSLTTENYQPYSMAYMEGENPKGALVVESPDVSILSASDDIKRYPQPGSYDMTLFFVGTTQQLAPLHLLSGLCKVLQTELPEEVTMTGYFPEGHVVKLIEGALGLEGRHEVMAKLDLRGI